MRTICPPLAVDKVSEIAEYIAMDNTAAAWPFKSNPSSNKIIEKI